MEGPNYINEIYLFGSFMKKSNVNDIDILIIYKIANYYTDLHHFLNIKKNIGEEIQEVFNLPIHFTLLSEEELTDINCYSLDSYIKIY